MWISPGVPSTFGSRSSMAPQLGAQLVDVDAGLEQQRTHAAALAVEQRQHHVRRLHELMVAAERKRLRIGQRLLELGWSVCPVA